MKPPRSILDPSFKWVRPANTDVGKYLRQWKREQRARQAAQVAADKEAEVKVSKLRNRNGS